MRIPGFLRTFPLSGLALTLALTLLAAGCGDVFRPVANPVAGPPGDPRLFHLEFVLNDNGSANAGSALHIDVSGDSKLAALPVGVHPVHAAIQPPSQARLFIADRGNDTVASYSPSFSGVTPLITTLPAGSHPVFLATTERTRMYVANSGTNSVGVIGGNSEVVTNLIPVGTNPVAMAETPDGKKLYVLNNGDNTVSVIDTGALAVTTTIPSGAAPVWALISPDGLAVYVLNQGDGTLSVVSTVTDTVIATLPVGASPNFMYLEKNSNRLYVTNSGADTVNVFSTAVTPPTPVAAIHVAPGPVSVAAQPNGRQAYVGSVQVSGGAVTATMTVIDVASNTVTATLPFTPVPQACDSSVRFRVSVAASADNTRAYLASCDAGSTFVINAANNTQVTQLSSPPSAAPPASPGAQPPPQNPVFLLSGP